MFHIFDPKFVKVEDLVRDQLQAVRTMSGREVKVGYRLDFSSH